jgi:ribosomal protein S18 acetylase RimI-like enzyme
VSLVGAVLARWLVELSGHQYFVTGLPWHATHRSSHVDGAEAERPDDAGYVHGLVIDRSQAGEGLDGQLLDWAVGRTRHAGRQFLRLDCAADNERLRG